MIFVRYQSRPAVWPSPLGLPLLEDEKRTEFVQALDERDCLTITAMVDAQLCSRGLRFCRAGSRLWCACEARVISDVLIMGIDLWEIAAQIEEARQEAQWECAA